MSINKVICNKTSRQHSRYVISYYLEVGLSLIWTLQKVDFCETMLIIYECGECDIYELDNTRGRPIYLLKANRYRYIGIGIFDIGIGIGYEK